MKKNFIPFLVFILGVLLVLKGYQYVYESEVQRVEETFSADSFEFFHDIESEILYNISIVSSLQAYFNASGIPSREAFKIFTTPLLKQHKSIKELAWLPHVTEMERQTYVDEARKYIPTFEISVLNDQGKLLPAPHRSEYYPAYYLEPYEGNESVLGFDFFSILDRRRALEKVRDSGKVVVTKTIFFLQKLKNQKGFFVFAPIYEVGKPKITVQDKRQNILGIVFGAFIFEELLSLKLKEAYQLNAALFKMDPVVGNSLLYSSQNPSNIEEKPYGLYREHEIKLEGETWLLRVTPNPGYYEVIFGFVDWVFLLTGALLTIATSTYLWFLLGYLDKMSILTSKFTTLLEFAPNAKFIIDSQNKIILVNKNAENLFGYTRSQLMNKACEKLLTKKSYEEVSKKRVLLKEGAKDIKLDVFILQKGGKKIPAQLEITRLIDSAKEVLFVCTFVDLREKLDLEKSILKASQYDHLTNLINRQHFEERLEQETIKAKNNNGSFFLFFIGIDQLKMVNDAFGHKEGDRILRNIANKIKKFVRKTDFAARIGGDEFAIISTECTNRADARRFAHMILHLFDSFFQLAGQKIKITASVGASFYPQDGTDMEDLIKKADLSMYQVRKEGGNNYTLFISSMAMNYRHKSELEAALDFALERNELYLVYQPIFEVPSQKIVGMEALLRWNHPEFGLVPPLDFIPIIEHKPLMVEVGEWVFKTACHQIKPWGKDYYISINVSPRQLQDKEHLQRLERFCEEENILPSQVVLEITESMLMQSDKKVEDLLKDFVKEGFLISIDDFGTQYSSLGLLPRLSISTLKIDKSFVDGIGKKGSEESIIATILSLAENLGAKVIAEGVETKEQYEFLVAHKCHYIQGFYLSKPLKPEDIAVLLRKNNSI